MKVAFFPGCMVDMFYPEVGIAAVNVLERLGCEVELPDDHVCCGQPFTNSGYIEEAKPMMKKVIDAYSNMTRLFPLQDLAHGLSKLNTLTFLKMIRNIAKKLLNSLPASSNLPNSL